MLSRIAATLSFSLALLITLPALAADIKVGIIGVDTPHSTEFTRAMNDPKATGPLAQVTVVAAYLGGSPDMPASVDLGKQFGPVLRQRGDVEIVDSIEALLPKVDAVMINSLDGTTHLADAKKVIAAGKPVFIDKPVTGSLAEAVELYALAKKAGVPCFSASSLRYATGIASMGTQKDPAVGKVIGCDAYSNNSHLDPHRVPDLFYYSIHGVETLFTIMGPGCATVARTNVGDKDFCVGVWKDGRIGTYRSHLGFGATVYGEKGVAPSGGWTSYDVLAVEIARFFVTKKPPVSAEDTLEIYAFLEAADQSKREGGRPVSLQSVLEKAK
jgi:predicted dehydrogenase